MSILRLMLHASIAGHHSNTSAEIRKVEDKLDAFVNLVTQLAQATTPAEARQLIEKMASNSENFRCKKLCHFHDVATDTSAETRKAKGKLDALVNLVTQLAVNQKPTSVARVCHHSSRDQTLDREDDFQLLAVSVQEMMQFSLDEFTTWLQIHLLYLERWKAPRCPCELGDTATNVEGKVDALVNLVTQLAVSQKSASIARVCGIRSSNDHHTNRRWLPTPSSFSARNDAIVIRGVHDVASDTSAETRKVEGKIDALVNLVTQLAQPGVNEHPEAYAGNIYSRPPQQQSFGARNDSIVIRGVNDVAIYTSAETRKVEGKLDALVNLVTQLAANQKAASVARVCGIRSSNDHHTNVCPSSKQLDFRARNDAIVVRGVHDVAPDTSAETRKVEGKLDALVNFVTQLVVNQKAASFARVCGIRSSNDHHTNRRWLSTPSSLGARNDAIVIRGVHDMAIDTSAETRKVEGNLDALVNLVTQLAANQKSASVAGVFGIRSSNDHHTHRRWLPTPRSFSARNDVVVIRGVHDVAIDTSAETRKVECKLDALVNLVTQLAVNQKPGSVARVWGISGHHSSRGQTLDREDGLQFLAVGHHSSRGPTLDREDDIQLLAVSVQDMMSLSLEEFMTWL
ncbi:hypothetical protein Fmac_024830 [Flemingia macrophylla]|uniref:Uncharacterized protein n=1 Tax=Flemingia macrophylla TaxID=520843 RepID=A0ABD1LQH6_9FABA